MLIKLFVTWLRVDHIALFTGPDCPVYQLCAENHTLKRSGSLVTRLVIAYRYSYSFYSIQKLYTLAAIASQQQNIGMKPILLVLVLGIVDLCCTLNLNQTVFLPLSVIASDETGSCLTQQQRDTAIVSQRDKIATLLRECGGGLNWTRVAYLNMSDPSQSCPPAWRNRSANGVRVCGRPEHSPGCHSAIYQTNHLYTRVCGQVIGYQFGSPDVFRRSRSSYTIDDFYVDGVSITRGNPRSHIWTFAAEGSERLSQCPCRGGPSAPPFVRDNYFCESGYGGTFLMPYIADPLWDGAGCESEGSCCSNAPWFTVDLVDPNSDDIEVRICSNNDESEEDSPADGVVHSVIMPRLQNFTDILWFVFHNWY